MHAGNYAASHLISQMDWPTRRLSQRREVSVVMYCAPLYMSESHSNSWFSHLRCECYVMKM